MITTSFSNRNIHRFSHKAMATVFEIYLFENNKSYAAQAANSAFMELDRLEQELSYFIENSDISRINNLTKNQMITVGLDAYECLKQCMRLYQQSKGAFDITMRPLLDLWKNCGKSEQIPDESQLREILKYSGLPWLQMDEERHQVRLMSESIKIDLGGFGKGYALDVLSLHLADWDIQGGLIHSGHSTVSVFGEHPESAGWPLSISDPLNPDQIIKKVNLTRGALSGSGLKKGDHIIDPRSGRPVSHKIAAWVFATDSGEADALSTAFMVMNHDEILNYCDTYAVSGLTIDNDPRNPRKLYGNWKME